MENKQIQKAGENAQQLQANNMIVNLGIDEKRAREIYQEMNLQLRSDYTEEALRIANIRVKEFENRLLPKMEAVEGALESFADPSFQLLLVEAQKTAASTERPVDYDLLSELLIHRFQKGENRVARAGIHRAVEIVDDISDDALLGLTVYHAVTYFLPTSGNIYEGLNVLNDLFSKIINENLPIGNDWLDHLDILDAIRIKSFSTLKKLQVFYSERLSGYIEVGIEKNSDNHNKANQLLIDAGLPQNILVEHELNSNYVRINTPNKEEMSSPNLQILTIINSQKIILPLSESQINTIKSIFDLYKQDESIKQQNIKIFMEEWDKRTNLKKLKDWWDNIPSSFQITSVGRVLAHSNAQRCDKDLPALN